MRNKSNRLEELFVRMVTSGKTTEDSDVTTKHVTGDTNEQP
jgi:ABC-2 type transport system ATP-binding protein